MFSSWLFIFQHALYACSCYASVWDLHTFLQVGCNVLSVIFGQLLTSFPLLRAISKIPFLLPVRPSHVSGLKNFSSSIAFSHNTYSIFSTHCVVGNRMKKLRVPVQSFSFHIPDCTVQTFLFELGTFDYSYIWVSRVRAQSKLRWNTATFFPKFLHTIRCANYHRSAKSSIQYFTVARLNLHVGSDLSARFLLIYIAPITVRNVVIGAWPRLRLITTCPGSLGTFP